MFVSPRADSSIRAAHAPLILQPARRPSPRQSSIGRSESCLAKLVANDWRATHLDFAPPPLTQVSARLAMHERRSTRGVAQLDAPTIRDFPATAKLQEPLAHSAMDEHERMTGTTSAGRLAACEELNRDDEAGEPRLKASRHRRCGRRRHHLHLSSVLATSSTSGNFVGKDGRARACWCCDDSSQHR
jgi:hypothetical protein